jgi:hypothetical protein
MLLWWYRCWNNGGSSAQPVFAQYLKDFDPPRYSVTQINTYPTTTNGVQVFFTLLFAWTSDGFLKGRRWPAVLVGAVSDPVESHPANTTIPALARMRLTCARFLV